MKTTSQTVQGELSRRQFLTRSARPRMQSK